jgi:glycosyltransferase involved in cell wall biosynthesis
MDKISIVIPVYNVEPYLPKCLDSIVGQTYKDLEIICVDDETPDNSVQIIKDYADKDSRIKLISQKNQGLSGARNTGIDAASGKYIVFVDSDDWIEPETCSTAVEQLEKNNADICMWGYVREFGGKAVEKRIFDGDMVFDEGESKHLIHRRIAGLVGAELSNPENADAIVTAWGKLYRADIIKNNKLYFTDTKIIGTEDALFNLYYFGYVKRCVFVDKPFNHYRKNNETSLTRKYKPQLFNQWSTLYSKMWQYINENNCPDEFTEAFYNRVCLSIIGLGLNELCNSAGMGVRVANLKKILCSDRYKEAYKELTLKYFPFYWKAFFWLCKKKFAIGVYIMLKAIQIMIGR